MSVLVYKSIMTPIGEILAGAVEHGICFLLFSDNPDSDKIINKTAKTLSARLMQWDNSACASAQYLNSLELELEQYFNGKRTEFSVPVIFTGTPFQNEVWKSLLQIHYGETVSYKKQSMIVGNAKAVRAVARANGANKICIVVPCHRVVGSNNSLTGYTGGLWRKRALLEMEQNRLFD